MDRRTFLKALGLAIAAPGAVLGAVKKPLAMGVDVATGESFTATALFGPKVIEANRRWLETRKRQLQDFRPTIINGNPFYVMFVHPRQHYALKVATARDEYKHKRWLIRHNRWLERQGKPPIHYGKAECGVWDSGVRIVETKRLEVKK